MSGFILAKIGAQLVAGAGVAKILSGVVKNNVVIATPVQKALVNVGTFVLGSMLFEQSSNHIERTVDNLTSNIKIKIEKKEPEDEEKETETE